MLVAVAPPGSAAPIELFEPWVTNSWPWMLNTMLLVTWSANDRGRPVTQSSYVARSGPLRRVILPVQSGPLVNAKAVCVTQSRRFVAVEPGWNARPIRKRLPPSWAGTVLMTCGAPTAVPLLLSAQR